MDKILQSFAYFSHQENISLSSALEKNLSQYDDIQYKQYLAWMQQNKVGILLVNQNLPLLNCIAPKVQFLSWIGNIDLLNQAILAIVGPRIPSMYATSVLESLFLSISKYQVVTISGGAKGIDEQAHHLSLKYSIPTIVVLGGGLKRTRDYGNRTLLQNILDAGGLVLSEFKLNFKPTYRSFPKRNRIVAGMGKCLFLPEASLNSGTMISVEYAYQMKRPIYSVPNSIYSEQSFGVFQAYQNNKLEFVWKFDDLLKKYFIPNIKGMTIGGTNILPKRLDSSEELIISQFNNQINVSIEDLHISTHIDYIQILQILTSLELEGLVTQVSPNMYQKI